MRTKAGRVTGGLGGAAGKWGDSRIEKNDEVRKIWFDEVNSDRYIQSSKELYKLLGFEQ